MKHGKHAMAGLVLLGVGALIVYAQTYSARIPFEFSVGKEVHPAGMYAVTYEMSNPKVLILRPQSGLGISVPILTRLAARETSNQEAQLVFDEVDGKYTLAELYFPRMDGFYLGSALVTHKHVTIKAAR